MKPQWRERIGDDDGAACGLAGVSEAAAKIFALHGFERRPHSNDSI
jgi:hypothetical protein